MPNTKSTSKLSTSKRKRRNEAVPVVNGRRLVARQRRTRASSCGDFGGADEAYRAAADHFERRRNRRCEPGHLLCVRQGEGRNAAIGDAVRPLWRLQGVRRLQGL